MLAPSTEGKPKSDLQSNFGYDFFKCVFSHQAPCYQHLIAPGLSSNVRSYTVSVNKQSNKTFQQEFVCDSESDQCSYTWNVADHEAVKYMVSVAANNVVGQSVTKNCTTTLIGQQLVLVELRLRMSVYCLFVYINTFMEASLFSSSCMCSGGFRNSARGVQQCAKRRPKFLGYHAHFQSCKSPN